MLLHLPLRLLRRVAMANLPVLLPQRPHQSLEPMPVAERQLKAVPPTHLKAEQPILAQVHLRLRKRSDVLQLPMPVAHPLPAAALAHRLVLPPVG